MKFIVDEMPFSTCDCPFYRNRKCDVYNCWCDRFDANGCVIDREGKECVMLKEEE